MIGSFGVHTNPNLEAYAARKLDCFALEVLPRTTRAQSMDILSSQANIAGYKAVLLATHYYPKFMPMMMTAAGTVKPARVLILGVGVAGLQAMPPPSALAPWLRHSTCVRRPGTGRIARRQVCRSADDRRREKANDGVYAKEMSDDYKRRQGELVDKHAKAADIIITTALIPGVRRRCW